MTESSGDSPGPMDNRGILYPTQLPTFRRIPAPDDVAHLVRWFWIPRWHIAPGRTSRQQLLPFPACNLVVEPHQLNVSGPTTRPSHRDLTGDGWAVGALLRPAGAAALSITPRSLRDDEVAYAADDLGSSVRAAMRDSAREESIDDAVARYLDWLRAGATEPDESSLLANRMEDLIAGDRRIVRVDDLADHLALSVRTTQRLADRYIGLTPLAIIRRYRLQEAAERLRSDPAVTIADVAADLAYTDHAHFSADFKRTLGFAPSEYRRRV